MLLSRWLHSKLISTLKFLSNWKTMFWVISQKQHSRNTLKLTETNSYFHRFTYEKDIFSILPVGIFFVNLLADRKVFSPKYSLFAWDTNQTSTFSSVIRYKWVNSIDWLTKLSLTKQGLQFFMSFIMGKIGKSSWEKLKNVYPICDDWLM